MSNAIRLGLMGAVFAAVLVALTLLLLVGGGGSPGAQQDAKKNGSARGNAQVTKIADGCASSVGEDGFGTYRISGRLTISNEEGEIKAPCRLVLERNGRLFLNNVKLRTNNLTIVDQARAVDDPSALGSSDVRTNGETSVRINASELRAAGDHGFLVDLFDADDSVFVHNSTLDYPVNVWVRASGVSDGGEGGGRIEMTNSDVRSAKAGSDQVNVQVVAGEQGGFAKFNQVRFDTVPTRTGNPDVLLFAASCQREKVQGGPKECDPAGVARLRAGQGDPVVVDGKPYVPPK